MLPRFLRRLPQRTSLILGALRTAQVAPSLSLSRRSERAEWGRGEALAVAAWLALRSRASRPSFPREPRRPVGSRWKIVAAACFVRAVGDRDHRGVVGFEHLPQQCAADEASVRGRVELHQRAVLNGVINRPLDVRVHGGCPGDGRPLSECTPLRAKRWARLPLTPPGSCETTCVGNGIWLRSSSRIPQQPGGSRSRRFVDTAAASATTDTEEAAADKRDREAVDRASGDGTGSDR